MKLGKTPTHETTCPIELIGWSSKLVGFSDYKRNWKNICNIECNVNLMSKKKMIKKIFCSTLAQGFRSFDVASVTVATNDRT